MNEAINRGDVPATLAAIVAVVVMIVVVDQVFWRPIVVWCQKYKVEETAEADRPQSWVLDLLQRSRLYNALVRRLFRHGGGVPGRLDGGEGRAVPPLHVPGWAGRAVRWAAMFLVGAGVAWAAWSLVRLLAALPLPARDGGHDWVHVGLAFARTSAAVLLGAAWCVPVGVMIGGSATWSKRLQPVVQVVASFPVPMLFPLVTMLLVFLRVPFTVGCVALMLLGTQWYILFNVIAGATAIPGDLGEFAAVYRMGRRQRWTKLYLPCVFPYLVTGLVTAAAGRGTPLSSRSTSTSTTAPSPPSGWAPRSATPPRRGTSRCCARRW